MIILYNNNAQEAVITSSTTDPDYPAENLKDDRLTRTFRTTLGTAQRIVFDFPAGVEISAIGIMAHNIDSGATIKLEGHTANVWTAPDYSETLTWTAGNLVQVVPTDEFEFWSIYINDTVNSFIEIGYIYLSTYISMPGFLPPKVTYNTTTVQAFSSGGQRYSNIGYRYRDFDIEFPALSITDRTNLSLLADSLSDTQTIIMKIFDDGTGYAPVYCVMSEQPDETMRTGKGTYIRPFSMTFKFREVF